MDHRQEGSVDLSGLLAVIASGLAVALTVAAAVTDREILLGAAAIAAIVATVLIVVRRSIDGRPAGSPIEPAPTGQSDTTGVAQHHDADADQRYWDAAVTARADLLATLRHGFHAAADRRSELDDSTADDTTAATTDISAADAPTTDNTMPDALSPQLGAPDPATPPGREPPAPGTPGSNRDPLFDPNTGLFTQHFFEASLPKRVSAARRGLRPLSVVAVTVVAGHPTDRTPIADPTNVSRAMVEVFREADTIAVTDDDLFLVLLEDTPEAGAVWTLERLRRRLTAEDAERTMWAGVSCYPAYSFDAAGLISQARSALDVARQWQQDRIEIAAPGPD